MTTRNERAGGRWAGKRERKTVAARNATMAYCYLPRRNRQTNGDGRQPARRRRTNKQAALSGMRDAPAWFSSRVCLPAALPLHTAQCVAANNLDIAATNASNITA